MEQEVALILRAAVKAGVSYIDTAPAYGNAESVLSRVRRSLGYSFRTISKTMPGDLPSNVVAKARISAELARPEVLDTLLVHHPADLEGLAGDRLWNAMQKLVQEGVCNRLGISASMTDNPIELANRFEPAVMQLPVSLLDQRAITTGVLSTLVARGVEVHARSIFLQGLILSREEQLPQAVRHIFPEIIKRRNMISGAGLDVLQACVAFAVSRSELTRIVVGVTSAMQLEQILSSANCDSCGLDWSDLGLDDPVVLDPSRWKNG